jgi:ribA/ribD-fused uncharacterized protein
MLREILTAETPKEAKALGRQVRGFDADLWAAKCFDIVVQGNHAKFGQNPPLREFLLSTRGTILVEAAPRDQIWGIGLGADSERARQPAKWRGRNLLGFAYGKSFADHDRVAQRLKTDRCAALQNRQVVGGSKI